MTSAVFPLLIISLQNYEGGKISVSIQSTINSDDYTSLNILLIAEKIVLEDNRTRSFHFKRKVKAEKCQKS